MLAELAAANAAYAVIKEALANGGQLHEMGQKLIGYFDASSEIEKKAQASGKSDMELFMAREQLKAQQSNVVICSCLLVMALPSLKVMTLFAQRPSPKLHQPMSLAHTQTVHTVCLVS